jgi:hypothetical protein
MRRLLWEDAPEVEHGRAVRTHHAVCAAMVCVVLVSGFPARCARDEA